MYICPRCGASEDSKKFLGPFCIDCTQFSIKIPDRIDLERCKRCGKMRIRGKWINISDAKLNEHICGKFKGEFDGVEFILDGNIAVFTVKKAGDEIKIEKKINFEINEVICPECNKQSGGYFEAIVQLRGKPERIKRYLKIFENEIEKQETFISKLVELKEGIDIYVGSTKAVIVIVKRLGLKYGISTTLAGQKQGKRLYRTTFAIRLE
ncbi:hypothetical protein KJ780_03975 [Candidatus Micrarchaeota archaeon]|nr:hypothetical protein [Candidatus Micrarchaeota archaeon]